jgi:hypothetical protein
LGNATASGTANNAKGAIYLYGPNKAYTALMSALNSTTSRTMYLPNYGGNGYLAHTAGTEKVGDTDTAVYVAANGRITAITTANLKAGKDGSGNTITSTYIPNSIGTAAGDIIYWSDSGTPARLPVGTEG